MDMFYFREFVMGVPFLVGWRTNQRRPIAKRKEKPIGYPPN
jgi:hypothetical protein